ncbi:MAG: glycosyltransferase family 4 protein [Gemmatimonadota bacterium]|nr:glycosyltransferase family 4 protein [Gemmatimonadota bacterium]
MNVLLLAPHPFYRERGTPIDVLLVLRVLSERPDVRVTVLSYAEGEDVDLPDVEVRRTPDLALLRGVRPGFSLRKLATDVLFFVRAWRLVRSGEYDLVHAGEEAAFMALVFRAVHGVPYAYDLDSSVAQQLVEQLPALRLLAPLFHRLEGLAVRRSVAALPVCDALAELCRDHGAERVFPLYDISQLEEPDAPATGLLREAAGIGRDRIVALYVGNLEPYQGVDLLLESFAVAARREPRLDLVVVGGDAERVSDYERRADELGAGDRVHFLGHRPFEQLHLYLADADILVSPRVRGVNTPMKLFAYLHSGKAVLATELRTHTQVITDEAMLAAPEPEAFGQALARLAGDPDLRRELGERGRRLVEEKHTFEAHRQRLTRAYDRIRETLAQR